MIQGPEQSIHATQQGYVYIVAIPCVRSGVVEWFVYRFVRRTSFDAIRRIHSHVRDGNFPLSIAHLAIRRIREVLSGQG